jgi:outer membrane protein assembly factor BamB
VVHDLKLFEVESPQFAHRFNSYASPTPVLEPGRVYVTFGAPGTACLDTDTGKVLWVRRDIECNHYRGAGSSPILHGELLLMHFDGSDAQFVLALDKRTGRTVWRRERSIDFMDLGPDGLPEAEGDFRKAFATPHVVQMDDRWVLISQGAKAVYAYDPVDGTEWWRVEERTSHSAGSRPVAGHGLIYVATGWSAGQLLAIRPGRRGEVIDANAVTSADASAEGGKTALAVAWKARRNVPRKPSFVLDGDLLFAVDDGGIASCLEARTGRELWRERIGGNYSASPLIAEGRIYFFSEEGKTTVIEAGDQFKVLAVNQLDEGFMASPAVSGRSLILRTRTDVYRIGS